MRLCKQFFKDVVFKMLCYIYWKTYRIIKFGCLFLLISTQINNPKLFIINLIEKMENNVRKAINIFSFIKKQYINLFQPNKTLNWFNFVRCLSGLLKDNPNCCRYILQWFSCKFWPLKLQKIIGQPFISLASLRAQISVVVSTNEISVASIIKLIHYWI